MKQDHCNRFLLVTRLPTTMHLNLEGKLKSLLVKLLKGVAIFLS